jgi:hypothetical protein
VSRPVERVDGRGLSPEIVRVPPREVSRHSHARGPSPDPRPNARSRSKLNAVSYGRASDENPMQSQDSKNWPKNFPGVSMGMNSNSGFRENYDQQSAKSLDPTPEITHSNLVKNYLIQNLDSVNSKSEKFYNPQGSPSNGYVIFDKNPSFMNTCNLTNEGKTVVSNNSGCKSDIPSRAKHCNIPKLNLDPIVNKRPVFDPRTDVKLQPQYD